MVDFGNKRFSSQPARVLDSARTNNRAAVSSSPSCVRINFHENVRRKIKSNYYLKIYLVLFIIPSPRSLLTIRCLLFRTTCTPIPIYCSLPSFLLPIRSNHRNKCNHNQTYHYILEVINYPRKFLTQEITRECE